MFMTIRRYRTKTTGDTSEIVRRVETGLVPILSAQPGFHWYKAIDAGDNVIASISAYDTREAADAANQAAATWVRQNLAELLGNADVTVGDVLTSASREEMNVATIRKGYEAFGRGDIPGLLTLFDPQIEWISPGPQHVPTAGRRVGHAAVGEFFQALNATVDITRFEPKQFLATGDTVVVVGDDTATVRATGHTIESTWAHVFTMKDGKVTKFDERADFTALAEELRPAQAKM